MLLLKDDTFATQVPTMAHVVAYVSLPLYSAALLSAIIAGILVLFQKEKPRRHCTCVLTVVAVLFIVIWISLNIISASRWKGGIKNVGQAGLVLSCLAVILLLVFILLDQYLEKRRIEKNYKELRDGENQ